MIENALNIIQMIVACGCMITAVYKAVTYRSRTWMLYGMFAGACFLGDLWWMLYSFFYGLDAPDSFIPYISWDAAVLFLLLILFRFDAEATEDKAKKYLSIAETAFFVLVMCLVYMQYGDYVSNLITAVLMGTLIWNARIRLIRIPKDDAEDRRKRNICKAVLLYSFVEYALWTASCFDYDSPIRYSYYVFDFLLAVSIAMFVPALGKAADR